jgi:hypothetical protein
VEWALRLVVTSVLFNKNQVIAPVCKPRALSLCPERMRMAGNSAALDADRRDMHRVDIESMLWQGTSVRFSIEQVI